MYNNKYKDPKNKDEIIKETRNAKTHGDVMKIINRTFPGWILGCSEDYSDDYEHYKNTWKKICNKIGCKMLNIVIVDYLVFKNKDYYLIEMFSELLTRFGHSVKTKFDFIQCSKCSKSIPVKENYNLLKNNNISVPDTWSDVCIKCK